MKRIVRYAVLTAAVGASQSALADRATTLGGLVIKSDDGNFVGSLGGRIQFDYTNIAADRASSFDSGAAENDSGFYFRRVYITLAGQLYGWRYRIDEDLANTKNPANGFNDVYIAHDLGPDARYGTVRIGQTKPWRSMDELTPNTDILFTNRNAVSAVGLLGGRDYQQGVFYRDNHRTTFLPHDNLWGGVSGYSLSKAGASTDQGTGTPTQGLGFNARLAYAPVLEADRWMHIGVNYSNDHADNGARLTAGSSDWYSYQGVSQNLASLGGTQPATVPTTAKINGGNNPHAQTLIGELAGAYGPVFLQGEVGDVKLRQAQAVSAAAPNEQTVTAYTVEGSVYLTGETKTYDPSIATNIATKPLHSYGAVELAARYDRLQNHDLPANDTAVCVPAVGKIPAGTTINRCTISALTLGVNYYVNPAVRLTVDYTRARFDLGAAGADKPNALNARFQLVF